MTINEKEKIIRQTQNIMLNNETDFQYQVNYLFVNQFRYINVARREFQVTVS